MSLSPELATACWYSAILLVKLATHSLLVSYQRLTRKVFANEEDAANGAGAVKLDDPNVERVRRLKLVLLFHTDISFTSHLSFN